MPTLVEPSLTKQDIEGLKRDIPKFFSHMPPRQREFWEKILERPEDLMLQGSSANWPLDKLKSTRQEGTRDREANEEVSYDITKLRAKEAAPLSEVGKFVNVRTQNRRLLAKLLSCSYKYKYSLSVR